MLASEMQMRWSRMRAPSLMTLPTTSVISARNDSTQFTMKLMKDGILWIPNKWDIATMVTTKSSMCTPTASRKWTKSFKKTRNLCQAIPHPDQRPYSLLTKKSLWDRREPMLMQIWWKIRVMFSMATRRPNLRPLLALTRSLWSRWRSWEIWPLACSLWRRGNVSVFSRTSEQVIAHLFISGKAQVRLKIIKSVDYGVQNKDKED